MIIKLTIYCDNSFSRRCFKWSRWFYWDFIVYPPPNQFLHNSAHSTGHFKSHRKLWKQMLDKLINKALSSLSFPFSVLYWLKREKMNKKNYFLRENYCCDFYKGSEKRISSSNIFFYFPFLAKELLIFIFVAFTQTRQFSLVLSLASRMQQRGMRLRKEVRRKRNKRMKMNQRN